MTCLEHVRGSTCSVFSETNAVPMMADTEMVSVPCDRTDPNECLKLLPKKSILKVKKPLFEDVPPCKRNSIGDGRAHFDEMNILATHHPAEKDYGHMKIEEPKTPFHHYSDSEPEEGVSSSQQRQRRVSLVTGVDAENLVEALEKNTAPVLVPGESDEPAEELESLSPEQIKHKQDFEKKRRAHYNEGAVLKAAKDQMCSDEDDEE
ncbi:hypothetical protein L596_009430 [Steinernema carpocapsae]|uniref:Protein phosphatase inhibitor 2 n=1 Tax=Steinernema carpocapsae TaxID=34508 RepID=A0A4U5PFU7_STECR|nr:hypothetical protein L596_009430 [Steinernema carpocapsae]